MPIVRIGKAADGSRWGCNCPSFRMAEPELEAAIKAFARSALVTVEEKSDGLYDAWTDPDSHYTVAEDDSGPGGWCKHGPATLYLRYPGLRQAALGALDWMERIAELEKENKKLRKEIERCKKKKTT